MGERTTAYYVTSIDRIGLAIGAGGLVAGFFAMLLMVMGGQRDAAALALGWVVGAIVAMLGIVAVAGPVWIALHRTNRRGPGMAAATGGAVAMLLIVASQIWGVGTDAAAGDAGATYRWTSAIATGLLVAIPAALVGWTMQRVAYRRLM